MSDMLKRFAKIVRTTTGQELDPASLTVMNTRPNDNPDIARNTACFFTSVTAGELKGGMNYHYNRLDLSKVFRDQVPNLQLEYGSRVTTRDIARLLGERYGLDFIPEDVEPSGEFYISSFPSTIQITAMPGNLCVMGSLPVKIVDAGEELAVAMGVTELHGINPPNGALDNKIQGAVYSWNWVAQPQLIDLLSALEVGDAIPVNVVPYLNQLSGVQWDATSLETPYNIGDARLSYRGLRDDHEYYASTGKHGYVYVIELGPLSTAIGGELLLTVAE